MILEEAAITIKDSALPPLRRLITSCEGRAAITGEALGLSLLPSQVAIRGMFLAKSTVNAEMSALRAFLHGLTVGSDDPNREALMGEFDWLRGARVRGLSKASQDATVPPSGYGKVASDHVTAFRRGVRGRSLDGLSDEELLRQVSGVRRENPLKVRNKENRSLLWKDYLTIMMDLSEYDPEEAMTSFVESGVFSPGVARVMIAALYLTGIRPVEVFGVNVYCPRTDIRYTDQKRALTRSSPITAIHDGLLRPIAVEARGTGLSRGAALVRAARMTGAAPVMSVLSAKQQNANKDLRFPVRFLVLDDIRASDANLLCWAAEFRNADSNDAARRRLSTQSSAILRSISAADPEMRQDVTLYTFRHSFASRARAALEENECSALTGHTAARTFRGYGERAPKVKGRGWLPTPDPERAEMIQQIWDGLVISPEVIVAENQARDAAQVATDAPVDMLVDTPVTTPVETPVKTTPPADTIPEAPPQPLRTDTIEVIEVLDIPEMSFDTGLPTPRPDSR